MRILLINPEKLIAPPFGLLYIGSVLKRMGHGVNIIEIPFEISPEERFGMVRRESSSFRPDIIGITCMSMQAPAAKRLIKDIKEGLAPVKVVVGGIHPTIDSRDLLSSGADIAVRGEGERTVLDIVSSRMDEPALRSVRGISFRHGTDFFDNPDRELIKDLNTLPPLAYELLKRSRFQTRSYSIRGFWLRCGWVLTARGCPGRCVFCASKTMHGRVVREFTMERVLDEVERLKKDYDIEGLWVFDDTFVLKERRVAEFCEGLKRRRIRLIWACQARVDTFTEGMARAMKSSGCVQVDFGVESGSQRILDYVKKDISCEDTRRAFRIARRNGLRALATVLAGVPNESEKDFSLTEELLNEIRPNFVAPFFITPYPGTELYDTAVRNGWLDVSGKINWQSTEEPLITVGTSSKEIKRMYNRLLAYNRTALFEYFRRPHFLLDMMKGFLNHPGYFAGILSKALKGDAREMMNTFLLLFRKEML